MKFLSAGRPDAARETTSPEPDMNRHDAAALRLRPRAFCLPCSIVGAWLMVIASARAQCGVQFNPTSQLPGTDGTVLASTWWDADGPGPAPAKLVVAGTFAVACTA